ncbi:MAG: ATP phosphoribosyltransferase [Gammaproteobacteria bacterium]
MNTRDANAGLTIALAKGRVFQEALPLFARIGIQLRDDPEISRKLILATSDPGITLVVIRSADVPTYVEYGAADLGVVGKDVLLEYGGSSLYEPLDLRIACCTLVVAGQENTRIRHTPVRVATKYVSATRRFFAQRGQPVEVIRLYGSMELAPLAGLADWIVDLMDTGDTLRANGLAPLDTIAKISSRLVVNKAAMKVKHKEIKELLARLTVAVDPRP